MQQWITNTLPTTNVGVCYLPSNSLIFTSLFLCKTKTCHKIQGAPQLRNTLKGGKYLFMIKLVSSKAVFCLFCLLYSQRNTYNTWCSKQILLNE